jgi:hypothetical protein
MRNLKPRLRFITALDNVALIETMTSGELVTKPSAAAYSYFAAKRDALFGNPTQNAPFFENAWLPWQEEFSATRKWDGYADLIAVRRRKLYANSLLVDAHGTPGSVQNNPNDPQNELRLKRFRPLYSQATLFQNRDEFTPITVDTNQIARLLQSGSPESTEASTFISNQITQAENRDMAAEFNTLMSAVALKAGQPGIFNLNLPNLRADGATADEARAWAARVRTAVRELADFVPWFSPAKAIQTVPIAQVRMVVRLSVMQALGTLAYGTSFNPEFVFALPADQIVELPDHYFDRNPGLAGQDMFIVDTGTDSAMGSISLTDTFFDWGVDVYNQKSSENRSIHHSSILDVNPFKTFITGGQAVGTELVSLQIVPETITADLYGPDGTIADAGNLVRGQRYSTTANVEDADGFPAGGWRTAVTDSQSASGRTVVDQYGSLQVAMDDIALTLTVTWTAILDDTVTVSQTFDLTGPAANYDGSGVIIMDEHFAFDEGTGAGGVLTYTPGIGAAYQGSLDAGVTWTPLGASPLAVAHLATLHVRGVASSGYIFSDGTTIAQRGIYHAV